jgi:hypothetical protein
VIQVILDTVAESEIQLSPQRLRIVRGALVTGLDLTSVGEASNALPACLSATGMPQLYDPHPTRPLAQVMDYIIRGVSFDTAEVGIVYIQEGPQDSSFLFRVGTSLSQEGTQVDKDGNPILVSYVPSGAPVMQPATKRLATVQKLEPLSSLTAVGILSYSPGALSQQFTGTVNVATWQGGAARTWLCTGIEGEQTPTTGQNFRTSFTFLYRQQTWDAFAVYVDANGQIPPDINPNDLTTADVANGLLRVQLYTAMDFTTLPF